MLIVWCEFGEWWIRFGEVAPWYVMFVHSWKIIKMLSQELVLYNCVTGYVWHHQKLCITISGEYVKVLAWLVQDWWSWLSNIDIFLMIFLFWNSAKKKSFDEKDTDTQQIHICKHVSTSLVSMPKGTMKIGNELVSLYHGRLSRILCGKQWNFSKVHRFLSPSQHQRKLQEHIWICILDTGDHTHMLGWSWFKGLVKLLTCKVTTIFACFTLWSEVLH